MDDDFELLKAWRDGDQAAGKTLFQRHFQGLFRFFRNKGVDAVDDLVQQTFLACVEARDRMRGEATFRTYMFAVARNRLFRYWKQRGRVDDDGDLESRSLHDIAPSAASLLVGRAEHRMLLEALRRIPLDYQIALELYYFENMRGPEIAGVLDVPEATIRSRIRRGIENLRRQVELLCSSPDLLKSTLTNLDDWARGIRSLLDTDPPDR